jgi:ABC-type amino acid transport substrate-binding protein
MLTYGAPTPVNPIRIVPWSRAFIQTETGKTQATLGLTSADKGNFLRSEQALVWDSTVLVLRSSEPSAYRGVSMLDGLRLAIVAGYTYDNNGDLDHYLAQRLARHDRIIELFSSAALDLLLPMLNSGRIDAFPDNKEAVLYAASRLGLADKISLVETGLGNTIHIGFTPNEQGAANLLMFEQGFGKLKASGRLAQLRAVYGLPENSINMDQARGME